MTIATKTAETQPEMLTTKVADLHGVTVRDRAAELMRTGSDVRRPDAEDRGQVPVAAFNASL